MKKNILAATLAVTTMLAAPVYAYEFTDTIQTPVDIKSTGKAFRSSQQQKDVTILKVKLSEKELRALEYRTPVKSSKRSFALSRMPASIQLGMNGVPVLDQGRHGSCVTFADSAAINAILGKGDYISQLCSLELGTHLEKNGYIPSGWNGSWGPMVLEQMMRFGVVSKEAQLTKSCASLSEYPLKDKNNLGNEMALTEYKSLSENINTKVYWTHLFSNDQVFDWKTDAPAKMQEVLANVKKAIANGHRLTFGTFLILQEGCHAGACASFKASKDTWALTSNLETPPYEVGGHELVITGYDDNAVAYDEFGGKHQGLLTLRNSWGADAGNNGDYYMSYDYFVKYANEVQEIIPVK
ncbi:MAG TPA: C1 family peptidase [Gammaproteobacteria bacterium]|jgi:C1A family cysteine protease|nr:C1 family peptidase [Gammaproteobacteria bacterium]